MQVHLKLSPYSVQTAFSPQEFTWQGRFFSTSVQVVKIAMSLFLEKSVILTNLLIMALQNVNPSPENPSGPIFKTSKVSFCVSVIKNGLLKTYKNKQVSDWRLCKLLLVHKFQDKDLDICSASMLCSEDIPLLENYNHKQLLVTEKSQIDKYH